MLKHYCRLRADDLTANSADKPTQQPKKEQYMAATNKAGVYGILCLQNEKWYIGSSRDVMKRIFEHRAQLRRGGHFSLPRLQADWNQYGEENFAFIKFLNPPYGIGCYENYLIEKLNTLEHKQGYNKMLNNRWGPEASIRDIENKYARSGSFVRLPGINAETPMSATYVESFKK
jgi:hypothetical protein